MNMQYTKSADMSLSDATKPLLVVSRLVGINPKSHWYKIYTGLILVCYFTLFYHVWQFHIARTLEDYFFHILVHGMQDVCYLTAMVLIWGSSLVDRRRFMVPLRDFAKIDESLKGLGGSTDNKGTYRLQIVHVIIVGLILLFFGLFEFRSNLLLAPDHGGRMHIFLLMGLLYHLTSMTVCSIVDCSFWATLSVIKKRFKEMNSIICRFGIHGRDSRVNLLEVSRAHTDNDVFTAIQILRNQYHDLWGIVNQVNDAYGLHLLVGMTIAFALITSKLFEAHSMLASPHPDVFYAIIGRTNCVLFYVIRISVLAQACESTVAEAKVTSVVLHKLRMKGNHSPATKEEIRDFFTQLQFETPNFTAYNFFDVNFSLICGILGTVCTYLVILIQMGDSNPRGTIENSNGSSPFGKDHHS